MKQFLIFTVLCLLSFFGYSQNGGQFNENNVIRVEYLGYFNGNHSAKVCNKQTCEVRIRTKADQDPAVDIIVPPNECVIVTVARPTSAAVLFRAKSETSCPNFTNPDMGWLEVNFISSVLNLTEGNIIRIIRGPNKYNVSLIDGVLDSDFGNLSENQHILIFNISGIKLYDRKIFVSKKSQINLNPYLKPGLNFIKVLIENKNYDMFIFKVYKN
jgi:hypothetical protein